MSENTRDVLEAIATLGTELPTLARIVGNLAAAAQFVNVEQLFGEYLDAKSNLANGEPAHLVPWSRVAEDALDLLENLAEGDPIDNAVTLLARSGYARHVVAPPSIIADHRYDWIEPLTP